MSKFKKFDFSIKDSFPYTLVSVNAILEESSDIGFSFTVEIDDKTSDSDGTSITSEEAKRLAFKKAIETIESFALAQGISI